MTHLTRSDGFEYFSVRGLSSNKHRAKNYLRVTGTYSDAILTIRPLIELTTKRTYLHIRASKITAERLHKSRKPEAEFGWSLSTKGPIIEFGCGMEFIFRLRLVTTLYNTVIRVFSGSGVPGCEVPEFFCTAAAVLWIWFSDDSIRDGTATYWLWSPYHCPLFTHSMHPWDRLDRWSSSVVMRERYWSLFDSLLW